MTGMRWRFEKPILGCFFGALGGTLMFLAGSFAYERISSPIYGNYNLPPGTFFTICAISFGVLIFVYLPLQYLLKALKRAGLVETTLLFGLICGGAIALGLHHHRLFYSASFALIAALQSTVVWFVWRPDRDGQVKAKQPKPAA